MNAPVVASPPLADVWMPVICCDLLSSDCTDTMELVARFRMGLKHVKQTLLGFLSGTTLKKVQ